MERTLIILKPDAVQRGLVGEIITRFEKKGLQIVGCRLMKIPQQLAETHYEPHKGKPFYPGLVKFMTTSPVLVLALEGKDAIAIARKMMGATFGSEGRTGHDSRRFRRVEFVQSDPRLGFARGRDARARFVLQDRASCSTGRRRRKGGFTT